MGVALIAAGNFAFACLCFTQFFMHDVRFQSGGYNPRMLSLQTIVGVIGVAFAPLGLMGVFDGKIHWIRAFNTFQIMKIAAMALVFAADLVVLRRCEGWAGGLEAQIHPNPSLYAVSRKGLCATARFYYFVGFAVDVSLNIYFAWVTHDLCKKLECHPAYAIRFFGGSNLAPAIAAHTQVRLYDETMGEPIQHLGPTTFRASDLRYTRGL